MAVVQPTIGFLPREVDQFRDFRRRDTFFLTRFEKAQGFDVLAAAKGLMRASQILSEGLFLTSLRNLPLDTGLKRQQAFVSRSSLQFLVHQPQGFLGRGVHHTPAVQRQLIDAAAHLHLAQLPFEFDQHGLSRHAFESLVYQLRGAVEFFRSRGERNLILQLFQDPAPLFHVAAGLSRGLQPDQFGVRGIDPFHLGKSLHGGGEVAGADLFARILQQLSCFRLKRCSFDQTRQRNVSGANARVIGVRFTRLRDTCLGAFEIAAVASRRRLLQVSIYQLSAKLLLTNRFQPLR